MQILFLTKITLLATTHLNQEAGLMIANKGEGMTFTKPWYQYYRKHLEVDETGAAKTYWKDNSSSGPRRCITIHLAEIWGHIKQKKGSSNYLRLYHQYIGTCKMINMLRKGIQFSIQRVYFPQSYFEIRHYGKRFNSIGKFKSLTFQLGAIYFHTFAVEMSVHTSTTIVHTNYSATRAFLFLRLWFT